MKAHFSLWLPLHVMSPQCIHVVPLLYVSVLLYGLAKQMAP